MHQFRSRVQQQQDVSGKFVGGGLNLVSRGNIGQNTGVKNDVFTKCTVYPLYYDYIRPLAHSPILLLSASSKLHATRQYQTPSFSTYPVFNVPVAIHKCTVPFQSPPGPGPRETLFICQTSKRRASDQLFQTRIDNFAATFVLPQV